MLHVVEDYEYTHNPNIDYVYNDYIDNITIINVKNNSGYEYLSNKDIRLYYIENAYSIDDLNRIISNLESCIDNTTDEDDIRSDRISIKLLKDYIDNEYGEY